ncbi:MAG TPA: ABC transporter substrate-binding protein [bacterium]
MRHCFTFEGVLGIAALVLSTLAVVANTVQAAEPRRIVSIGGALTETVFALGMGEDVVGVDTTSTFPAATGPLPKVGYARTLGAEAVLSLRPTRVLASEDAGPPETLQHLRTAGVDVRVITVGDSPDAVSRMIGAVAETLDVPERGKTLQTCVADQFDRVRRRLRQSADRRVLFLLSTSGGDMLVSGTGTRADAMITLAGGTNAVRGYRGYKPFSPEAAATAQPDVLLMTTEGLKSAGGVDALKRNIGLAATPALQRLAVEYEDSLYLLGFGPRAPKAVYWLASRLHPGFDPAPLDLNACDGASSK